tara:strand:- start:739969 stop:741513 length:1545 start_codon:yes stop_codon:yes gene_type:complete
MKSIKRLFLISSILIFHSCISVKQTTQVSRTTDDGKIDFTFLQLNDVYEIAPLEGGKVGGMARVATLKKELITENSNTFTFLAGDFLSPSLLSTIKHEGERIKGKQMVEAMNAVGFDLVTLGNHEFDVTKSELQKRLNESTFAWTSANARQKICGETYPFYKERNGIKEFVSDTYIIEATDADGTSIKIGFFGVVLPSNPQNYVEYKDIYEQSKRAYTALKSKVDVVFGLTHLELEQDKEIAELLSDIPLIMGGHEHNNMLIEVGKTKIAKADANAKTAYIHRIHYNKNTKEITIDSELKPINEQLALDISVNRIVTKWDDILENQIKEIISNPKDIIYTTDVPLDGRDIPSRSKQTNLGTLITKAMAHGYNDAVDCALVNGGSIRLDDQLEGAINSVDVFRVLPFGGSILKVDLKGNLLKDVLDYGKDHAGSGAYLQQYLADYDEGSKTWKVNGKPLDLTKIYTVAFSDYLLKGYDIPFLKPENKDVLKVYVPDSKEVAFDIRKTIVSYLNTL